MATPAVQIPDPNNPGQCCNCQQQSDCSCGNNCFMKCRSFAGFSNFCGFAAYTDPLVPPRYYLTQTLSGSATSSCGSNATFCTAFTCSRIVTYSGAVSFDPLTCAQTNTGQVVASGNCGATGTFARSDIAGSDIFCSDVSPFLTETTNQLQILITPGPGGCRAGSSGFEAGICTSSNVAQTLSDEDTIQNAIIRATPANPTWDGSDNGNCLVHTSWSVNNAEGSTEFAFQRGQVQVGIPTAVPGATYQVIVMLSSRTTGSNGNFIPYGELETTVQTAPSGQPTVTDWLDIPQDTGGGLEIAAVSCKVTNLSQ